MSANKFTDCRGRTWSLLVTTGDLPALRLQGWNLNPKDGHIPLAELGDPETLGKVLWTLLEEQAAGLSLAPEQFARGFDGPTNQAALDALLAAAADFTHRPKTAAELKTGLRAAMDRVDERTAGRVSGILSGWSGPAGNSPASPGSTPGPSPSGSSSGPPAAGSGPSGAGTPA